jgi:diguanylate cyclase (GGDEF)-like protein
MGGDEFVVLFPDARDTEAATAMLTRLAKAIRALSWKGHAVGVSIGIAVYPEHGRTRDALLETADDAMYQAKSAGKNTIVIARQHTASPA